MSHFHAFYLLDKYKLSADHQTVIKAAYDKLVKERAVLTDRVKEKELKRDELTMQSLRRNLNSLPMLSSRFSEINSMLTDEKEELSLLCGKS